MVAVQRKRIYVAGPISKGDTLAHIANGIHAADRLLEIGFLPFCPHAMSAHWHMLHPKSHSQWMDFDLQWVAVCDGLLRIPGESIGADLEVAFAEENGIPVFHDIEDLVHHFRRLEVA